MRYWNPGINQESNAFITRDAVGLNSPLSPSTTTTYVLSVPDNATKLLLFTTSSGVQLRHLPNDTAYFTLPQNTLIAIPVATLSSVHLTVPGGAVVNFMFLVI